MRRNCFADKDLVATKPPGVFRSGQVIPQGLRSNADLHLYEAAPTQKLQSGCLQR